MVPIVCLPTVPLALCHRPASCAAIERPIVDHSDAATIVIIISIISIIIIIIIIIIMLFSLRALPLLPLPKGW